MSQSVWPKITSSQQATYMFLGDANSIFAFGILNVCVFGHRLHDNTAFVTKILKESGKSYQRQHSARKIHTPLMFVAYVKWQFVKVTDSSRYPFLLPQLAPDALQNVPFCSGERRLQGHALLAAATPSPRQLCLASSHLLPSLLLIQKVRFVRENCIFWSQVRHRHGPQKLHLSAFRDSSLPCCMKQGKSTFVPGTKFLYRTKHRLVHF